MRTILLDLPDHASDKFVLLHLPLLASPVLAFADEPVEVVGTWC